MSAKTATDNLHVFSLTNSQVVLKGASKKLSLLGVSVCFYTPFLLNRAQHKGQRAGSDCPITNWVGLVGQIMQFLLSDAIERWMCI